jgi:hypothetical protein
MAPDPLWRGIAAIDWYADAADPRLVCQFDFEAAPRRGNSALARSLCATLPPNHSGDKGASNVAAPAP